MATCLAPRHLSAVAIASRPHCAGSKLSNYIRPFSSSVNCKRRLQTVRMARTESQQSEIGTPAPDFQVRRAWRHGRSRSICVHQHAQHCMQMGRWDPHSRVTVAWHGSCSFRTQLMGSRTHHWTMWQRDRRRYWFSGSAITAPSCWPSSVRGCIKAECQDAHCLQSTPCAAG
jgi:hypothetical protein